MTSRLKPDAEYLPYCFRHFADMCQELSPLYAALSRGVADDPQVWALVAERQPRQPPPNLLFGSVHCLLLSGVNHPLADSYPSVGGTRSPDHAYPAFADFCRQFREQLVELISTSRVQTNEVGRCGLLMPAFSLAWERCGRTPLHLIDVGCSAGLNLSFDHYHYEYSDGRARGPNSTVCIRTRLRGDRVCPLPDVMPTIAGRVGVDIHPVSVLDDDAVRWVEAMIWADQVHRIELFRHAVRLARQAPPHLVSGQAMDELPRLVEAVGSAAVACVFHSHTTYQMTGEWRDDFEHLLAEMGQRRRLMHISLEWLGDDPGPQLHLTDYDGARRETIHLADCDHHGAWMRWLTE